MAAVNPSGSKGADLHRQFTGPPYGWPRDAVNGALLTLLSAGNIRAVQDGKDLAGAREVQPTQIGKLTLYKEDEPPSVSQRLAVKGLLAAAGIPYESGQEGTQIPALLQRLKDLAAQCGGEPPVPQPPSTVRIDALLSLSGNLRFRSVADDHEQLNQWLTQWQTNAEQRKKREIVWNDLQRLVRHAQGLAVAAELAPALEAVRESRQLLDDPDPVTPIRSVVEDALRAELQNKATRLSEAQRAAVAELESWESWGELNPTDQAAIVEGTGLGETEAPDVSSGDKLLQVLDDSPLKSWNDRITFVPGRRDQARFQAAKLIEPDSISVTLPSATIRTETDLMTYLDDVRSRVKPHLDADKTVII